MATIYQTTDIVTSGTAVNVLTTPAIVNGDTFVVARDTSVVSTGSDAFAISNNGIVTYTLRVEGTVHGDSDGVFWLELGATRDNVFTLSIGSEGTISGARASGFDLLPGAATSSDGWVSITNLGTVSGFSGNRIVGAEFAVVHNAGLIEANTPWLTSSGLFLLGTIDAEVVNTGTIRTSSTTNSGLNDMGALRFDKFDPASILNLVNTGVISGPFQSISSNARNNVIENNGLLDGDVVLEAGSHDIANLSAGRILGDVTAVGQTILVNQGTILGDITFTSIFGDTYRGFGGTVIGTISTDGGSDTFFVDQSDISIADSMVGDGDRVFLRSDLSGATNIELIQMQGGGNHSVADDDSATQINGNVGNNVIDGAGGNDTIRGGQGLDVIDGGTEDDLIIGNSGDDEIDGGDGADTLFGGIGNDQIAGGFGTDDIAGGAGDDVILPGRGQDRMTGGFGADIFVFGDALDAGSGSSADRIDNFVRGEDLIDLIALGSTPASFIGTAGFSGGGNMEVRYTVNPFGNALVRIDEDGNGTEDARIVVSQTALLEASDFLL